MATRHLTMRQCTQEQEHITRHVSDAFFPEEACWQASIILAALFHAYGYEAEVVSVSVAHAHGFCDFHVYVRSNGVVYDPTVYQFRQPVYCPCVDEELASTISRFTVAHAVDSAVCDGSITAERLHTLVGQMSLGSSPQPKLLQELEQTVKRYLRDRSSTATACRQLIASGLSTNHDQ